MKSAGLRIVERLAGPITVLVGAAVLLGWVLDVPALKSVFPGMATMKPITALCFILSGAAFRLGISEWTRGKARPVAMVCPVLVLLAAGLTLAESSFGWTPGIDGTSLQDAADAGTWTSGRMSPITALAFVLLSTAFLLLPGELSRARRTVVGSLGALTALLGLFAVLGWTGKAIIGYGWGELSTMALHSGALFVLLGAACAVHVWRDSGLPVAINKRLLAGFGLGLAVFIVLSMVSYKSERQLSEMAGWVRHTHEVLTKIQKVNSDFMGVQTAVRGFVITGRGDFLTPYHEAVRELQDDEGTLRRLTADNRRQQSRLNTLEDLIRQRLAFSEETLNLYRLRGFSAAAVLISSGRGQQIMKEAGAALGTMERDERELLIQRETQVRDQTVRTFFILSAGTLIGLGFLLAVLFFLNSEASGRHVAEANSRLAAEVVKSTNDAVITKTLAGIITSWNPSAERIFGYTELEAIGCPVMLFIPPEYADEEAEILAKIGRGERVEDFETVRLRKDGRRANVSVNVTPLRDSNGRVSGAAKILRDITERKQAEEALRANEERFKALEQNSWDAVHLLSSDGVILYESPSVIRVLGYSPEELVGRNSFELLHPDDVARAGESFAPLAATSGLTLTVEVRVRHKDGSWRWTDCIATNLLEHPAVRAIAVNYRDVTERKRTEDARQASEERLNFALQTSQIGAWELSLLDNTANRTLIHDRIFGYHALLPFWTYEMFLEHVLSEDRAEVDRSFREATTTVANWSFECRIRRADGEVRWIWAAGGHERGFEGKATRMSGIVQDVTGRKRMEEALRESEGRYRTLFEYAPDGIIISDAENHYLDANVSMCRLLGYTRDELLGLNATDIIAPEEIPHIDPIRSAMRAGNASHREWQLRRKDGSVFPADVVATQMPGGSSMGMIRDITQRKQSERRRGMRNAVSQVLADAASLAEATPGIIRAICEAELWDRGSIWELDAASQVLCCREIWHRPDFDGERIAEQTRALTFAIGQGLPGRVWASGEMQLISDVALDAGYLRAPTALAAGLHSALAFPIFVGNKVTGVIDFAAREIRQPDGPLFEMFVAIGRQVGQFIERERAEVALREGEERFRTMANSIPQLAWIARADGFIHWYNDRWYEYTGTTPEQMEGWGWQRVHDPGMLPKVMESWTGGIRSGQSVEMEFPLRGADGKFRTFLTRVQPLKDAEGRVMQWFGTNTDVDELKQMEGSLQASQARLKSTLSAGSIGTWTWDIVNDCLAADEFTARMFSIEPHAAAKGLPAEAYLRAVMAEDRAVVAEALARAIESCGHYDIEYRVRQKGGELVWLQAKGRVEGDAAGKALSFHGAVMDITERKQTEGRFRRLVDSNAQGVIFWNTKGEISGANDAFLRIVGYSREDLEAGRVSWVTMTPPEYVHLDRRSLEELAVKGTCTPFEKEYICKDGSRVPVLLGAATFEDNPQEGVCFVLDMTERKQADQALRESEEHFHFLNDLSEATRTLADPAQIMAVTARMLGEHLRASRCAYADVENSGERFTILHDYTDGCMTTAGNYKLSLFGERAVTTLCSGQTLIVRNVDEELLPGGGADMFNAIGIKAIITCPLVKDGGLRAMMAVHQSIPRDWTPGEIIIVQEVVERCWDTIERRAAEENIRQLNAELEQRVVDRTAQLETADRAKSVFLSTMSHEIRTPMNAVLGYSQLMLRDPELGADAKMNLRIINRSGEHLLSLINDVLDISKIEAGRTKRNLTTFSLAGLLSDVSAMFRLRAEAKALRFEVLVDGESVPYLVADEGKIRQALINLLGNAIKFTARGYIRLHVTLDQRIANRTWFSARVEDTGPGISEEEQKNLFQPFSQTRSGLSTQEGTGLGLAISRANARLMGGDLTVTSSPGTGSIFQFDVPIERGDTKVTTRTSVARRVTGIRAGQEVPRILVADDLLENRDWLVKLLRVLGFSVQGVENGEAALRSWEEWKPRLILMDVHMPVMDGLEATRRIKADPRGNATVIIALTASAMEDQRRTAILSGVDDFITKPCSEHELLEKMRIHLNIAYDYEEISGNEDEPAAGATALSAERLGQLPQVLIAELRNATLAGNKRLLDNLILRVGGTGHAESAKALQRLADLYEYDALIQLLKE